MVHPATERHLFYHSDSVFSAHFKADSPFVPGRDKSISLSWSIYVESEDFGSFDCSWSPDAKPLMPSMVYEAQASTFPSEEITGWSYGE